MPERSKAEREFIDQRTRQLLVTWCDHALRGDGTVPDLHSLKTLKGTARDAMVAICRDLEMHTEYFDHAVAKGWLGAEKDGKRKVNAAGWTTAKSFLKR